MMTAKHQKGKPFSQRRKIENKIGNSLEGKNKKQVSTNIKFRNEASKKKRC